jgi:RecA/RadA recombinase
LPNVMLEAVKSDLILPSGVSLLDRLFGGGLSTGQLTHIYGEAASGKTTVALQFVSSASRIGVGTVYINTESASPVERLEQISGRPYSELSESFQLLVPKDFREQAALVDDIELYAKEGSRLVVVDTLTRLYRTMLDDQKTNYSNHRELNRQTGMLKGLAKQKDMAVVVLNQVRSRMDGIADIEPVAENILDYWADFVLRVKIGRATGERILYRTRPEGDPSKCVLHMCESGLMPEYAQKGNSEM